MRYRSPDACPDARTPFTCGNVNYPLSAWTFALPNLYHGRISFALTVLLPDTLEGDVSCEEVPGKDASVPHELRLDPLDVLGTSRTCLSLTSTCDVYYTDEAHYCCAETEGKLIRSLCIQPRGGSGDGHTTSRNTANTCRNGFTGFEANGVCCSASCGTCGGTGCLNLSGGPDDCCTAAILASGVTCDDSGAAPCILSDVEGVLLLLYLYRLN